MFSSNQHRGIFAPGSLHLTVFSLPRVSQVHTSVFLYIGRAFNRDRARMTNSTEFNEIFYLPFLSAYIFVIYTTYRNASIDR